jgi:hypothetical protein
MQTDGEERQGRTGGQPEDKVYKIKRENKKISIAADK